MFRGADKEAKGSDGLNRRGLDPGTQDVIWTKVQGFWHAGPAKQNSSFADLLDQGERRKGDVQVPVVFGPHREGLTCFGQAAELAADCVQVSRRMQKALFGLANAVYSAAWEAIALFPYPFAWETAGHCRFTCAGLSLTARRAFQRIFWISANDWPVNHSFDGFPAVMARSLGGPK